MDQQNKKSTQNEKQRSPTEEIRVNRISSGSWENFKNYKKKREKESHTRDNQRGYSP
jgi:hypothetical protein